MKVLRIALLALVPIFLLGQTFSVGKYAITGGNAQRSDADRWNDHGVNILEFGADPTGTNDSTAAIQAAIDSLNGTTKKVVYCPDGFYKTSLPIYLDPPGNMRSGTAWNSGTTYASGNVVTSGGIAWKSLTNGNLNNTPGITSTFWTPWSGTVSSSQFSYTLTGNPPSMGNGNDQDGCSIQTTFNNAPAIISGPGNGMVIANLNIIFGRQGGTVLYRGQLSPFGIGIAITGDGGGSQRAMVENVEIDNFSTGILTGFIQDGLGAENKFRRITINDCFQAFILSETQNFINDVAESTTGCTISYTATIGHGMAVRDSNPSACCGKQAIFTLSSVSLAETGADPPTETLTATLDSSAGSDTSITNCQGNNPSNGGCVYNYWGVLTPGFGVVPMQMTSYNYSTRVGTFVVSNHWRQTYFGVGTNTGTDFATEMNAVTTMYAAESVIVFSGVGFHGENLHIENGQICQTFFFGGAAFGGDYGNSFKQIHFNQTPGLDEMAPPNVTQSDPRFSQHLCQQSTPLIAVDTDSADVTFESMGWGQSASPFLIDGFMSGSRCHFISAGADGAGGAGNPGMSPLNPVFYSGPFGQQPYYDPVQGYCDFDSPVYGVNGNGNTLNVINLQEGMQQIEAGGEYGYFPKPWIHPRLQGDTFTLLQSITGSNVIGSYPIIYGNVIYSVNDPVPDTGGGPLPPPVAKLVQSNHTMGSYGRNLTTSDWAALSWKYTAGGTVVMADTQTLKMVFPGLGVLLNNGGGNVHYQVTGVHPHISLDGGTHPGYFNVCAISNMSSNNPFSSFSGNSANGCITAGTIGTTYTGTAIGQDAFAWNQIGSQVPLGTPALSACGTSPALTAGSLNTTGSFTTGTATPTACTLTFSTAFQNLANCTISAANAAANGVTGGTYVSAQSKSAFTVTLGTGTNSAKYNYVCSGN